MDVYIYTIMFLNKEINFKLISMQKLENGFVYLFLIFVLFSIYVNHSNVQYLLGV